MKRKEEVIYTGAIRENKRNNDPNIVRTSPPLTEKAISVFITSSALAVSNILRATEIDIMSYAKLRI